MPTALKTNDVTVEDINSKRKAFAAYYEDLTVPKTESHFNENFLEVSEYRCKLIENIVCHEKEERKRSNYLQNKNLLLLFKALMPVKHPMSMASQQNM